VRRVTLWQCSHCSNRCRRFSLHCQSQVRAAGLRDLLTRSSIKPVSQRRSHYAPPLVLPPLPLEFVGAGRVCTYRTVEPSAHGHSLRRRSNGACARHRALKGPHVHGWVVHLSLDWLFTADSSAQCECGAARRGTVVSRIGFALVDTGTSSSVVSAPDAASRRYSLWTAPALPRWPVPPMSTFLWVLSSPGVEHTLLSLSLSPSPSLPRSLSLALALALALARSLALSPVFCPCYLVPIYNRLQRIASEVGTPEVSVELACHSYIRATLWSLSSISS
jgi:hypothetical protein